MNRIDELFRRKKNNVLSIYFTAGFPQLDDTRTILDELQNAGADMVEIGIPFSDSLADGPVIQQSNQQALKNGMSLKLLFEQLSAFRKTIDMPAILMGSLNPVLQFGMENFLRACNDTGIDGVILPDLPVAEYEKHYREMFETSDIHAVFLVTPETKPERVQKIDALSRGFIYAVSSSSTTGKEKDMADQAVYFQRLQKMQLHNPVLVGFGIRDKATFDAACAYSNGAVIGTAFIRALQQEADTRNNIQQFVKQVTASGLSV